MNRLTNGTHSENSRGGGSLTNPSIDSVGYRTLVRVLWASLVLLALCQVLFYFCRTVDDMFISHRYAARLVGGDGLTYNDNVRVEGFSNLSWVGLQALLMAFGLDGVVATKLLSLGSYSFLLAGLYRLGRGVVGLSKPLAIVALLMNVACSYVASWALWGLETPLFLGLIIWFAVLTWGHVRLPSRWTACALAFVAILAVATRPEAPLYLLAIGLAAIAPDGEISLRSRFRALVLPGLLSLVGASALLGARFAYFGEWFPQTYFAKQGFGTDWTRLAPLVSEGATTLEGVYFVGALIVAFGIRSRLRVVAAVGLANLFFVASVTVDWMPNQRHFLPLIILAPFAWLWLAQACFASRRRPRPAKLLTVAIALILVGVAIGFLRMDVRFSPNDFATHGKGKAWVRYKTAQSVTDAMDSLARRPTAGIEVSDPERLGMIDQLFRVMEASSVPERESWFIGRDIGRVGYYSPIQIIDTAGLFTPMITESDRWMRDRGVDEALIATVFARSPVATDLLDGWGHAAAMDVGIQAEYEVMRGEARAPVWLRRRDAPRPSPLQVLERYERVVEAFRAPFYQATLYGESVGAAVEKRYAWIHPQLAGSFDGQTLPSSIAPSITLGDGLVELGGCRREEPAQLRVSHSEESVEVVLACYWRALRPIARDWRVFVHVVDPAGHRVTQADHAPVAGLRPTSTWPTGEWVRAAVLVYLPKGEGSLEARVGLFIGGERMVATAGPNVDTVGRAIGPRLR